MCYYFAERSRIKSTTRAYQNTREIVDTECRTTLRDTIFFVQGSVPRTYGAYSNLAQPYFLGPSDLQVV